MKKSSIILLLAFACFQLSAQNFKQANISVTGTAEIEIEPDIITLSIVLNEKDGNKKMTIEQKETLLKGTLVELGIEMKKLVLEDALSNFDKSWWKKDEVKTTKTFSLRLENTKTLSKVLVAFRDKELSNVRISSVDHSKRIELQKEARIKAIKAAKEKAIYLTEAVGQKIGKALQIAESQPGWTYNYNRLQSGTNVMQMRVADDSEELPELSFKKIKITASISAIFEIL